MNYWEISEAFLKIPPCLDQMSVQVAEIEKNWLFNSFSILLIYYISLTL